MELLHRPLKTLDAAIELRRNTDVLRKELRESTGAEARGAGELRNCGDARSGVERLDSEVDDPGGVPRHAYV